MEPHTALAHSNQIVRVIALQEPFPLPEVYIDAIPPLRNQGERILDGYLFNS